MPALRFVLSALLCGVAVQLLSQSAEPSVQLGKVRMEQVHELRKGLDLWPLIVTPRTTATQKINATLAEMNGRLRASVHRCDTHYRMWARNVAEDNRRSAHPHGDWERKIQVTMVGPRYLSLVVEREVIFCGSAYPNNDNYAFVFDLRDGNLVDPASWFSAEAPVSTRKSATWEENSMLLLVDPALESMSRESAVAECRDAFSQHWGYLIWPDARKQRIIALPAIEQHVLQGCSEKIELTAEQARRLGFRDALLRDLLPMPQETQKSK